MFVECIYDSMATSQPIQQTAMAVHQSLDFAPLLRDMMNAFIFSKSSAPISWKIWMLGFTGKVVNIYIYIPTQNDFIWFHHIQATNKMVVKPMNNWGVHHWNRANCGSGVLENKDFAMLMFWLLASIVLRKTMCQGMPSNRCWRCG